MSYPEVSKHDPSFAAQFAFRRLGDGYLLTNPAGQYAFVSGEDLAALLAGTLDAESQTYRTLAGQSFIASKVDTSDLDERIAKRFAFLRRGPWQHELVLTSQHPERRALGAAYDTALGSADADMPKSTLERCITTALRTPSGLVQMVFRGGEPLATFELLRHAVGFAKAENEPLQKDLGFSVVTSLAGMNDEIAEWLVRERVHVVTEIDGPPSLHDQLHATDSGSAFANAKQWIERLRASASQQDVAGFGIDASLALTRDLIGQERAAVDSYLELGVRTMMVELPHPALEPAHAPDWQAALASYLEVLRAAIDAARQGSPLSERLAAVLLSKILQGNDPNYPGLRSPAMGGRLVYGHDGNVYPSELGRRAHLDGDELFCLGNANETDYANLVRHENLSASILASTLAATPGCVVCTYQPFCGTRPDENYLTQGSLQGRMQDNHRARFLRGVQDFLFETIRDGNPDVLSVFERWSAPDQHRHFVV